MTGYFNEMLHFVQHDNDVSRHILNSQFSILNSQFSILNFPKVEKSLLKELLEDRLDWPALDRDGVDLA
jgi:hypothetical protein